MKQTIDVQVKKIMMARIVEELVSSTEDLSMWLSAVEYRDVKDKKRRDIWEYLLLCDPEGRSPEPNYS